MSIDTRPAPNSFSTEALFEVDRHMGLTIMFDGVHRNYFVVDVNGITYYGQSPKQVKAIMDSHGRRVLKRKAYLPKRFIPTSQLRQVW